MRWTRRWRRAWRTWRGLWRRSPGSPAPAVGFPVRPAPGRWRGWRRLLALYLVVGLVTGGMIALASSAGPALRTTGRHALAQVWRTVGEVVPATRFLVATDPDLPRLLVRESLPLRRPLDSGQGRWMDRLVEQVTGLNPAVPEGFLRQTVIARGGGRNEAPHSAELGLEPVLAPNPSSGHTDEAFPRGRLETPPDGEGAAGETVESGSGSQTPVPPIQRRPEQGLRRYPWGTAPLIGVYHTHSSEAYHGPVPHAKGRSYSDLDYVWGKTAGVVSVGDELARILTEDYRIPVVHSRNIHDYPVFRDAYTNSGATARMMLRRYPTLRLLLDVHRDGLAEVDRDFITTVMGGERLARIALIVGKGQPGLPNPHWERNLALAQQLHAKMEEMYPGLSRGVTTRNWPYNQELTDRALLLEVGDHFNTKEEALKSAALLADCLAALLADLPRP